MRAAALGLAIAVLGAACSVLPPAGTRPVAAEVTNLQPVPIVLTIETPTGVLPIGAQPGSLRAGATETVTFFLPPGEDWWIAANGLPMFPASDTNMYVRQGCHLFMDIDANGAGGLGCGG